MNDDEHWLLLHIMCGTKRLDPFVRLHEASEVLAKYVMRVWQGRRQDFAARGETFFKYNIGCMQLPWAKYEMGVPTPLAPH